MAAPKVITWGDIREGDVVSLNLLSQSVRVEELRRNRFGVIYLNHGYSFHNEHARVLLLHRPWPEGKTEADMLNDVIAALIRTGVTTDREELKKQLSPLRDAIDAYELGKPAKE